MLIYACILNIQVPHEVKYQRAIAKRTSPIMKYGQDVIIQNGKMYIQLSVFNCRLESNICA